MTKISLGIHIPEHWRRLKRLLFYLLYKKSIFTTYSIIHYTTSMIVILHNIRSTHNVGSIFRTADAVGVQKIYLCGITPDPTDLLGRPRTDIIKASLGAEKTIPWEHVGHSLRPQATLALIAKLKKQGYTILSLEQHKKSISLFSYKKSPKQKIALVVGNEVDGIPQSILSHSDAIVEIPMHGTKESLNVSVACGIAGYHLMNKNKGSKKKRIVTQESEN